MVNNNDSIRFTNVVSKKYRFHYLDLKDVIKDFLNAVVNQEATIKGPLFYSLHNVPMDEFMNVEFYMPIQEDSIGLIGDMYFHSYFNIENMLSVCLHNNFENHTEVAYRMLLDYIKYNKLRQSTPIFHVFSGDRSLQYVFIKMGVIQMENNEQFI